MPTEAESEAAKRYLDRAAELAGRDQPVPRAIIAGMLEAAERVRRQGTQGDEA